MELPRTIERGGRPPVLPLTAAATRWIQRDIVEQLRMRDAVLVVSGTDRPNLLFEVVRVEEEQPEKAVLRSRRTIRRLVEPGETESQRDMDGATVRELQDQVGLGRAEMVRMMELLKAAGVPGERRGRLMVKAPDFDPA